MEVACRDDGQPCLRDPPKERRPVEELEAVEERRPALGVGSERRRRPVGETAVVERVRVGGDQRRPFCARGAQSFFEACTHADEPAQAECDGVAGRLGLGGLMSQLEAREHEQVVQAARAIGFGVDLAQVGVEVRRLHVVVEQRVIGDREHVEAVASVEIAELAHADHAVAPGRVRVELAEEWVLLRGHDHIFARS